MTHLYGDGNGRPPETFLQTEQKCLLQANSLGNKSNHSSVSCLLIFRGDVVELGMEGSLGICLIPQHLRYLDWNRVWVVPFFHSFYYGIVKNLMDLIFPSPGSGGKDPFTVQPEGHTIPLMLNFPDVLNTSLASKNIIMERNRNMVSGHRALMCPLCIM